MNVHLGETFDNFVEEMLSSGEYQSQSEVIRAGLQLLKEKEDLRKLRLLELRREIQLGLDSGSSEPLNIEEIIQEAKKERFGKLTA
ncbi:type II toxin-antitoxin system ParD family antitoxin [Iningainema tapete]|uniref:Type II toxin-antitoxin system ParD family antitoxin n=1 Tax=Iningainema tapete BLCC-T55 TaxID=2748662 RepID=A0A8J6XHR9_9CYAN|nr:type II toxin-antitoxin system ParD family antitoxin [Iningainema tapete]MBD2770901.1 type II toxin-antitoxin system ParD family antitoxin [Iningainema tapete BLCC-T55]